MHEFYIKSAICLIVMLFSAAAGTFLLMFSFAVASYKFVSVTKTKKSDALDPIAKRLLYASDKISAVVYLARRALLALALTALWILIDNMCARFFAGLSGFGEAVLLLVLAGLLLWIQYAGLDMTAIKYGKSKPEDFATKVPLDVIEQQVRRVIKDAGVPADAVRTEEIGNTWRERGMDFLVSKRLDITLSDFETIERIRKGLDTRGINAMYIGELKNKNMAEWHEKGRTEALKAARNKAEYMASAAGCRLGRVMRIVEGGVAGMPMPAVQTNVMASGASSADTYRTIKKTYTVLVRYELADWL